MKSGPGLYERFKRFTQVASTLSGARQKTSLPGKARQPDKNKPDRVDSLKLAGWKQLHEFVYSRSLTLPNPYKDLRPEPLFFEKTHKIRSELCFYDTETTGLSGGAGNVVFLLGLGRIKNDHLLFEQYFLADFPGEPEFLSLLSPKLRDDYLYVSYNGSAFDRHILQTRYIMHGMQKNLPNQLDLLFTARRLWKPLIGHCSLHQVEEQVLDIIRKQDVPGQEVPALYFEYLRTANPAHLKLIFTHNKQDILSLIHLYYKLQTIFEYPLGTQDIDSSALGRMLLALKHPQAEALLEKAAAKDDPRCAHILSMHYKANGRWEEALKIWQQLYNRGKNTSAGLELAKYWEHKKRQYGKALSITEDLLANAVPHPVQLRRALQHRSRRLRQKISHSGISNGTD
ncbi:MAG: ribonuclease H-like domain-containing protein [Spirochaetales bacterium]|nr:ribonuclease H-like domain-containing protein [Spirochaetales bacterium]